MNWANRITLGRFALTVLFVVALNSSWQYARTAALFELWEELVEQRKLS